MHHKARFLRGLTAMEARKLLGFLGGMPALQIV